LVAAHEIFQKPFKVDLQLEEIDTPKNYRSYPDGEDLPAKLMGWRVHPDTMSEKNYGLVSDGFGFEDSPDCERISGGVNSKGPGSVALGRQGNWFLWGFCAPPAEMTEPAKRAFLNTVVYMKRFDGQRPLVNRTSSAREWAYVYANLLKNEDGDVREHYTKSFSPKILAATGQDPAKVKAFLKENESWIVWEEYEDTSLPGAGRPGASRPAVTRKSKRVAIDEDAKSLGLANCDPGLLDRCVSMLEKGDQKDLALRILQRYTDEKHGTDAAAWRKWLDANQGRLYFTDTGGYRFRSKDAPATSGERKE
jgi:hypothetical protein